MGVQNHGNIGQGGLDALDEVLRLEGAHGAGHILEADGLEAHLDQLLAHLHVLLHGVHRALGVGDAAGGDDVAIVLLGVGLHGLQGGLDVAEVVEGVKDANDVDAVLDGQLYKLLHHVVVVVLVAQQVLAPEQHLELGVGHVLADVAQPLPGILPQVAQAGVEGGAAPALHRVVPGLVHGFEDVLEVGVGQTGRHQGLVGVSKDCFGDLDFLCHKSSSVVSYLEAPPENSPSEFQLLPHTIIAQVFSKFQSYFRYFG